MKKIQHNKFESGMNPITFLSQGDKISGNLYLPENFDVQNKYPTIIYTRPGSQVKEQTGATYGEKFSKLGYVFLAFDPKNFGDSEGVVRNHESMHYMLPNTIDAISVLRTFDFVDREKFYGLGVCAGATYISSVALGDSRIKAIATVGGNYDAAAALFGNYPKQVIEQLREMVADARQKYYETDEYSSMSIYAGMELPPKEDTPQTFKDAYEYYFVRAGKEVCPNYSSEFPTLSFPLDPNRIFTEQAKYLAVPSLIIAGENSFTKPIDQFVYELTGSEKEYYEIKNASQMDLYDIDEYVDQAVEKINTFFGKL